MKFLTVVFFSTLIFPCFTYMSLAGSVSEQTCRLTTEALRLEYRLHRMPAENIARDLRSFLKTFEKERVLRRVRAPGFTDERQWFALIGKKVQEQESVNFTDCSSFKNMEPRTIERDSVETTTSRVFGYWGGFGEDPKRFFFNKNSLRPKDNTGCVHTTDVRVTTRNRDVKCVPEGVATWLLTERMMESPRFGRSLKLVNKTIVTKVVVTAVGHHTEESCLEQFAKAGYSQSGTSEISTKAIRSCYRDLNQGESVDACLVIPIEDVEKKELDQLDTNAVLQRLGLAQFAQDEDVFVKARLKGSGCEQDEGASCPKP